jgi:carbonic anhydrase
MINVRRSSWIYRALGALFSAVLLVSVGVIVAQEGHSDTPKPTWSYVGEDGPANWGQLDDSYMQCGTGQAQSPIDIQTASALNLSDIQFNYGNTALNIFNNGHTIEVEADTGNSITYNGITYQLAQFHFHTPSEHTFDGQPVDMELHLVHRDPNSQNLAVVGVLLMAIPDDLLASNTDYAPIFDRLPAEVGEPTSDGTMLALETLLPPDRRFYTYNGSLTTPPCSEVVRWLVLDQPVGLSQSQVDAFKAIYALNARPTQSLNERDLLLDTR